MIPGIVGLPYEERLGQSTLDFRRLRGFLIERSNILTGLGRLDARRMFLMIATSRIRGKLCGTEIDIFLYSLRWLTCGPLC